MTATRILRPLDRPKLLHVSVQDSLKRYIAENALTGGDMLPAEATLARDLGVSRNSVREAVKALESLGMLETRRGIGVFVRAFSLDALIDNLPYALGQSLRDVEEIIEIRKTLEVAMVERAIAGISAADIEGLRRILDAMRSKAERGESFADADQEFHRQLFHGVGNRMLSRMIEVFWLAFRRAAELIDTENPDPMATFRDHEAIVDAVERRDAALARERLARHYHGISTLIAEAKASGRTRSAPGEGNAS